MPRFTLQIESEGAEITDSPEDTIAGLLRKAAKHVDAGIMDGTLLDGNGNTIGSFTYNES